MQPETARERIAYELWVDSAKENIDYLEVRWAPRLHLRARLTVTQVIEAVLAGLRRGPIKAVAIVCAMRSHSTTRSEERRVGKGGRTAQWLNQIGRATS